MKLIAFIEDDTKYIASIKRYLKYLIDIESSTLRIKEDIKENTVVFIDENRWLGQDLLKLILNNPKLELIVLGTSRQSNNAYINLLDLSRLNTNIQRAFIREYTPISPFFYFQEVKSKLELLFEGHGEKSLFKNLNMSSQALCNGPNLLKESILEWEDYKETLKYGIENWDAFKKRLKKYEIYLKVCGFKNKIEKINQNIKNFQEYINELVIMREEKIKKIREAEIKLNNDYLEQIDRNLDAIKKKIDTIYGSL